ncbi:hypothetical protein G1C97_0827 [Bifidobacterium sp. DSM 109959]|uniref:Uncharacterized protein n=1 Tax=Bifidobacterium olomucense TaxID=2675324 RepID=A0A7Y0HWP8_9BIFI|nr:hypothetical protein [Bifidobacterium sp. DSM 109959]
MVIHMDDCTIYVKRVNLIPYLGQGRQTYMRL